MPLYQYECENCGKREDTLLTFAQADANPFFCPDCQKRMTRLVVAPFSFTFAQPDTRKSKVNPRARQVRR